MSVSTVLVGAGGSVSDAVREALRDWVALDLVEPFLWVEAAEVPAGVHLSDIVATSIEGTRAPRVRLQDHLADQRSVDTLRVVLVSALGGTREIVDARAAELLRTTLPGAWGRPHDPLHVVLTRQGAGGWDDDVDLPGWPALVVAPEDRWGPSHPASQLSAEDLLGRFVAHAAAAVASIAGLWDALAGAPLPFEGSNISEPPRVVRAFVRGLDAETVTAQLRAELTDLTHGLPRPLDVTGPCLEPESPDMLLQDTLSDFHARHMDLLRVDAFQMPRPETEGRSSWQAIKGFLAFLAGVIRRAPQTVVDAVTHRAATEVSRRVQSALFGANSRIEVVTRGINASGTAGGLGGAVDEHRQLEVTLDDLLPAEFALPDTSPFWRSFVDTGLSLVDGAERTLGVGRRQPGAAPLVLRTPSLVSASPADVLPLPTVASGLLKTRVLQPHDVYARKTLEDLVAAQQVPAAEAQALQGEYATWRDRITRGFAGRLAEALYGEMQAQRQQLSDLVQRRMALQDSELDPHAELAGAWSVFKRYLVGLLLLALVGFAVDHWTSLATRWVVILALVLWTVWSTACIRALVRVYMRIHQLAYERQRQDRERIALDYNIQNTARAVRLRLALLRQLRPWASALGSFLADPLGSAHGEAPPPAFDGHLPRSVGIGTASGDADAVSAVAHELRSELFRVGWLSDLWSGALESVAPRLNPPGRTLREAEDAMWSDPARDDDSPMMQWYQALSSGQSVSVGAHQFWASARELLMSESSRSRLARVVAGVDVRAQGNRGVDGPMSYAEFFQPFNELESAQTAHYFDLSLFTSQAQANNWHVVDQTFVVSTHDAVELLGTEAPASVTWTRADTRRHDDLNQFAVALQVSRPVPRGGLTLRGGEGDGSVEPSRPAPTGPDVDLAG
jgi:hypothetical protein